jgi:hypothetical protein
MRMNKFDKVLNEASEGIAKGSSGLGGITNSIGNIYSVAKQAATNPSLSQLVNIASSFFSERNKIKPVERSSVEIMFRDIRIGIKEALTLPVFAPDAVVLYDSSVTDKNVPNNGKLIGRAVPQNDTIVKNFLDFLQKNNYKLPPIGNNSGKRFWVILSPKGNTTLNTILTKWQQFSQEIKDVANTAKSKFNNLVGKTTPPQPTSKVQIPSIIPDNEEQYYTFYIVESVISNNIGKFTISRNPNYNNSTTWNSSNTYLEMIDQKKGGVLHKLVPVKGNNQFNMLLQAGPETAYGVWYFCKDLEKLQSKNTEEKETTSSFNLNTRT